MEPIGGEDQGAEYELCCNIHIMVFQGPNNFNIMRAMKLVAIGGMVLNFFWVPYMALTSPFTYYDFGLVALCLYALILVAMRKENPRLLIPFLIFNALSIGVHGLYCFILLIAINNKQFWDKWKHDHPDTSATAEEVGLYFHFVLNLAKLLLNCWFEHIVYRGYLFMMSRAEAEPLLGEVPIPNA